MDIKVLPSPEAREYLEDIARLRISVFREWPYLYEGSLEYERSYLESYFRSPRGMVVLAFEGKNLVGVSTAVPLADASPEITAPIEAAGFSIRKFFYFGESVLLPEYRGMGTGKLFFDLREEWALQFPEIKKTCFSSVVRSSGHRSVTATGSTDPQPLWLSRGYTQAPHIVGNYSWPDIGSDVETTKPMQYWLKEWTQREIAVKLIQSYYRAFNAGNHAAMLDLLSEDVIHDINEGSREQGKAAFARFLETMKTQYREQLSDFVLFAHDSGERAAAEFVCTGEYLKAAEGLPPARGQKYRLGVGAFFEIMDRKITRVTNYYNASEWVRQVTLPD